MDDSFFEKVVIVVMYFCRVRSKEVEIFFYLSCYVNNDFNWCCFDLYYILSFSDLYGRWQFGKV